MNKNIDITLSLKYGFRSAECAEPLKYGTTESAPKLRKKTHLT
jgi:hypothetical protein